MRKLIVLLSLMLSITFLPGVALSGSSSDGTASVDYGSLTFSRTDLNWLDPTLLDTRASFSGVSVTMNGDTQPYQSDPIDGAPWGNTAVTVTHPQSTPTNFATGAAFTNVTNPAQPQLSSSASVVFNTFSPQTGSVDTAQAVLSGQFTVLTDGWLTVTAKYKLHQALVSSLFASSYVAAGLTLSDFNGTDPNTGQSPILASDLQFLLNQIDGDGSLTLDQSGLLTMTFFLIANDALGLPIVYDFEHFTDAEGSVAVVPEPMSFMLVAAGMIALAAFRRKFA